MDVTGYSDQGRQRSRFMDPEELNARSAQVRVGIEHLMDSLPAIAVILIAWLAAITVHEAAHAGVADLCGLTLPRQQGRVSLNPCRHVSMVGSILVPAALLVAFGVLGGWGRPVEIDVGRHTPRRVTVAVALAGPISNALLGLLAIGCLRVFGGVVPAPLGQVLLLTAIVNALLAAVNLLPVPGLDGAVWFDLLVSPTRFGRSWETVRMVCIPLGLGMLYVTGILGSITQHVVDLTTRAAAGG